MRLLSASGLQRVIACPASASLPAVIEEAGDAAKLGTALHLFLQRVVENGRKAALSATPEDVRPICAAIDTEWVEAIRADAAPECAFVYNALEDTAQRLGKLDRGYPTPRRGDMFVTVDLPAYGESMMACDYKTGRHRVAPCRDNWQMRLAAVAMAQQQSCDSVWMRIAYLQDDGSWDFDDYHADAIDLAAWTEDLKAAYLRAEAADSDVRAGKVPDVHPTDEGCRYCVCRRQCPAFVSAALAIHHGTAITEQAAKVRELQPSEVGAVFHWLQRAKEFVKAVESDVTAYLEQAPVPLANGKTLRLIEQQREYLDGDVAHSVIAELVGADKADAVCTKEVTKTALKALGKEQGRVMDAIRSRGGVTVKTYKNAKECAE